MGKRRFKRAHSAIVSAPVAPPRIDNVVPIHALPKVREERFAGIPINIRQKPELRRTFDAGEVNAVLNAPGVFEHLAIPQLERLDCAAILEHELNVALVCEGGAFLFFCHAPGIYDVCVAFLPGWRGAYAAMATQQARDFMFLETDCMALTMRVPVDNKAPRHLARRFGARLEFHRNDVWPIKGAGGKDWLVGMSYFSIRYEDWVLSADGLIEAGRAFIDHLFGERKRLGALDQFHDQDLENPRFIGAFAKMAYAGQLDKAVILYNRFAVLALLPPIALVSRSPAMVEVGGTLIQIKDGSFKAILLR